MDVSSLTNGYKDEQDDPNVYGGLWELLKSDPSCTRAILNDGVVLAHLGNLVTSVNSNCVPRRLVIMSVLNCTPLSALRNDTASNVLSAAVDTVTKVEAEPHAINVCLRTVNAILAICEGEQDIKCLLNNLEFMSDIVKTKQNASILMDLVYLTSTHPWVSKIDAENWLQELETLGILWWLRRNLTHVKKLDFLEILFADNIRLMRNSRVVSLQSTARSLGICKSLQFCSFSEFAISLPSCSKSEHQELVRSLNLQLKVDTEMSDLKILEYFTRSSLVPENFWPHLFSHDLESVAEMWISPSRNMYFHALKVYMHEFTQLSHDVRGFLSSVVSRFTEQNGRLQGHSKYAIQDFQLILNDDAAQQVSLKINTENLFDGQDFLREWNKFNRRSIIFLKNSGDKVFGRIQRVSRDQDVIDVKLKVREKLEIKTVHLVCILNDELEARSIQLQTLLDNALFHDSLWIEARMDSVIRKSSSPESLLVSHVFATSHQLEKLLDVDADNQEQDKKRRRTVDFKCALDINFQDKSYSRAESAISKPELVFTDEQLKLIRRGLQQNLSVINGEAGTGKSIVLASILDNYYLNSRYGKLKGKTIAICDTEEMCHRMESLLKILPPESVVCWSESIKTLTENKRKQISKLLSRVQEIAVTLGIPGEFDHTIEAAFTLFNFHLKPMLEDFARDYPEKLKASDFPLADAQDKAKKDLFSQIAANSHEVANIFESLDKWRCVCLPGDLRKALWKNSDLVLVSKAQLPHILEMEDFKMDHFQNLVLCNANYFQPLEIWQALSGRVQWSKLIISGDFFNGPIPFTLQQFIDAEATIPRLVANFDTNPEILKLRSPEVSKGKPISGLGSPFQLIGIPGEIARNNVCWEEAEYCVFLYAYLRLIGYPAHSISIITLSPYQKSAVEIELQNLLQSSGIKKLSRPKCVNVMYQTYSHRNKVVIVATSGLPFDVSGISRMAKDGLLVLTSGKSIKGRLKIVVGEKYPNVKSMDQREVIEISNLGKLQSRIKGIQKHGSSEK
ncbi:uncharacterized protein LALA0_S05e03444g [Lachancea lanzarotensis]|uniref:LALA0S05e03444g1_1 n=1 Tax=Lachancea lanzarotensis TaxID=1245769 RepID=A0A0C7N2W4_9SACH|nr:uncharacterized protein LALA0_S05e03444g [Lachancea lanzarotensis]CEP62340.1 LALA0S05e03444g1_1 [Lachancea lanzarotensis]